MTIPPPGRPCTVRSWPASRVARLPVRVRRLLYGALWVILLGGVLTCWPVQFGGPTGYTIVSGHSMEPVYHPGDLLITRSQQHYQPGQIVVYTIPAGAPGAGFHVVHRLIAGSGMPGETGWVTKGDNNPSDDIWTPHDGDIEGAVVLNLGISGLVLRQARNPLLYCLLGALTIGRMLWPKHHPPKRPTKAPQRPADQ